MTTDPARPEIEAQRRYYERNADRYDARHVADADEHGRALGAFMGLAEVFGRVESVLDVGAGTGRALAKLKARWPDARVVGIEPVAALREIGYGKGIARGELLAGDVLELGYGDDAFDYVIETGVLHHVRDPVAAVREMVRVARLGVLISDSNNVGQGRRAARTVKFWLKRLRLWPVVIWLQTRGTMYKTSEGDGIYYSFSAFDCCSALKEKFPVSYMMNTEYCEGFDLYRGTPHVMIFARRSSGPNP